MKQNHSVYKCEYCKSAPWSRHHRRRRRSGFLCDTDVTSGFSMPKRTLESNGGVPGIFVEMVFHPGPAREHAVPPMWSRTRPGALLPATSGESDPRHGSETQRVSFVNKLIPRRDCKQTWR